MLCVELDQLLQDVSAKRKEESERQAVVVKCQTGAKVVKKSKEKIATDIQAGKDIREASMMTMNRDKSKRSISPRSCCGNTTFIFPYGAPLFRGHSFQLCIFTSINSRVYCLHFALHCVSTLNSFSPQTRMIHRLQIVMESRLCLNWNTRQT